MSECWSEKPEERPTFKWICTAVNRLIKDTKVEKVIRSFQQAFCRLCFYTNNPRPALSRLGQGDGEWRVQRDYFNPHAKSYPHRGTRGGRLMDPPPPPEFSICCSISKRFCLQWKAFYLVFKMRYILWVVALLEVCDVTKHGRHLWILSRIRNQIGTARFNIFCA